ncbi:MAG: zinc ribbon domain-containing protein [Promethearchaeota archaeon]
MEGDWFYERLRIHRCKLDIGQKVNDFMWSGFKLNRIQNLRLKTGLFRHFSNIEKGEMPKHIFYYPKAVSAHADLPKRKGVYELAEDFFRDRMFFQSLPFKYRAKKIFEKIRHREGREPDDYELYKRVLTGTTELIGINVPVWHEDEGWASLIQFIDYDKDRDKLLICRSVDSKKEIYRVVPGLLFDAMCLGPLILGGVLGKIRNKPPLTCVAFTDGSTFRFEPHFILGKIINLLKYKYNYEPKSDFDAVIKLRQFVDVELTQREEIDVFDRRKRAYRARLASHRTFAPEPKPKIKPKSAQPPMPKFRKDMTDDEYIDAVYEWILSNTDDKKKSEAKKQSLEIKPSSIIISKPKTSKQVPKAGKSSTLKSFKEKSATFRSESADILTRFKSGIEVKSSAPPNHPEIKPPEIDNIALLKQKLKEIEWMAFPPDYRTRPRVIIRDRAEVAKNLASTEPYRSHSITEEYVPDAEGEPIVLAVQKVKSGAAQSRMFTMKLGMGNVYQNPGEKGDTLKNYRSIIKRLPDIKNYMPRVIKNDANLYDFIDKNNVFIPISENSRSFSRYLSAQIKVLKGLLKARNELKSNDIIFILRNGLKAHLKFIRNYYILEKLNNLRNNLGIKRLDVADLNEGNFSAPLKIALKFYLNKLLKYIIGIFGGKYHLPDDDKGNLTAYDLILNRFKKRAFIVAVKTIDKVFPGYLDETNVKNYTGIEIKLKKVGEEDQNKKYKSVFLAERSEEPEGPEKPARKIYIPEYIEQLEDIFNRVMLKFKDKLEKFDSKRVNINSNFIKNRYKVLVEFFTSKIALNSRFNNIDLVQSKYYKFIVKMLKSLSNYQFPLNNIKSKPFVSSFLRALDSVAGYLIGSIIYYAYLNRSNRNVFPNGFSDFVLWLRELSDNNALTDLFSENSDFLTQSKRKEFSKFIKSVKDNIESLGNNAFRLKSGFKLKDTCRSVWLKLRTNVSPLNNLIRIIGTLFPDLFSARNNSVNFNNIMDKIFQLRASDLYKAFIADKKNEDLSDRIFYAIEINTALSLRGFTEVLEVLSELVSKSEAVSEGSESIEREYGKDNLPLDSLASLFEYFLKNSDIDKAENLYYNVLNVTGLKKEYGFSVRELYANCFKSVVSLFKWYDELINNIKERESYIKILKKKIKNYCEGIRENNFLLNSLVRSAFGSADINFLLRKLAEFNEKYNYFRNKYYCRNHKDSKIAKEFKDRITPTIKKYQRTINEIKASVKAKIKELTNQGIKLSADELDELKSRYRPLETRCENLKKASEFDFSASNNLSDREELDIGVYKIISEFFRASILLIKLAIFENSLCMLQLGSMKEHDLISDIIEISGDFNRYEANRLIKLAKKYRPTPSQKKKNYIKADAEWNSQEKKIDHTIPKTDRGGINGLSDNDRKYLLDLFKWYKEDVNSLLRAIFYAGASKVKFQSASYVKNYRVPASGISEFVCEYFDLLVKEDKAHAVHSPIGVFLDVDAVKEMKTGIEKFYPGKGVLGNFRQGMPKTYAYSVEYFAVRIMKSMVDYLTALIGCAQFFKYLISDNSKAEIDIFTVLNGKKERDSELVKHIYDFFKKVAAFKNAKDRKKRLNPDSKLLVPAIRRLRNFIKRSIDTELAATDPNEFKVLKKLILELCEKSKIASMVKCPELTADVIDSSSSSYDPTFFKLTVIPLANAFIGDTEFRSREFEFKLEVAKPNSGHIVLRRRFWLDENKLRAILRRSGNYRDLIDILFELDEPLTEFYGSKAVLRQSNHFYIFCLYSLIALDNNNINDIKNELFARLRGNPSIFRRIADKYLKNLNSFYDEKLKDFLDIRDKNSLRRFFEAYIDSAKNNLAGEIVRTSSLKDVFSDLFNPNFFDSLDRLLGKDNKNKIFGKNISFNRLFPAVNDYCTNKAISSEFGNNENFRLLCLINEIFNVFSDDYYYKLTDRTLSPCMLRIAPGGRLELITRWDAAIRGQKRENKVLGSNTEFTFGVDLGVSELITFDIRNDDASIEEHDPRKYSFSDSEGDMLEPNDYILGLPEKVERRLDILKDMYYDDGGLRDRINYGILRIRHLWGLYFEKYSEYSKLASKKNLNRYRLSLLRKYYLEAASISDKIKRSYRSLSHLASGFLAKTSAILPVDRFYMENLRSYNIAGRASRYSRRLRALNRELSSWIRGSIADMLKYKLKCVQTDIEFAEKNPYRTSKLCHICKTPGKRGKVSQNNRFIERGYGLAFICINPLCENYNKVINADLNAARNICTSL